MLGIGGSVDAGAGAVIANPQGQYRDETRHDLVIGVQRQIEREHPLATAEEFLAFLNGALHVRLIVVSLRDDDGAGHANGLTLIPQQWGRRIDSLAGRDDEKCGVGRPEPCANLSHSVGVPVGVEDVEAMALPIQGCEADWL